MQEVHPTINLCLAKRLCIVQRMGLPNERWRLTKFNSTFQVYHYFFGHCLLRRILTAFASYVKLIRRSFAFQPR